MTTYLTILGRYPNTFQRLLKILQKLSEDQTIVSEHSTKISYRNTSGAIIGDGDRKSWNPRGPMIWDNLSIFRTNCAILTSYIRADPRTCRGFSRGCFLKYWREVVVQ